MKILEKGGILVTCSCSHFFDENTFYAMLMNAAQDAHRTIQILEKRGAAPDHPVLVGYPKSEYLKCAILRVL
ncbi:MAG: class I SAM-dependent rRNA methyltransferase, partial [Spirochaetaceae bacterium]|nr:class I SAM-dependent rRNA methyltransferase [Spirochaetaceae bacterium]